MYSGFPTTTRISSLFILVLFHTVPGFSLQPAERSGFLKLAMAKAPHDASPGQRQGGAEKSGGQNIQGQRLGNDKEIGYRQNGPGVSLAKGLQIKSEQNQPERSQGAGTFVDSGRNVSTASEEGMARELAITGGIPLDPMLPKDLRKRLLEDIKASPHHRYSPGNHYLVRRKRTIIPEDNFDACPHKATWKVFRNAINVAGINITIVQTGVFTQSIHEVTCNYEMLALNQTGTDCPSCCLGIDRRSYTSQCCELPNYQHVIVYDPNGSGPVESRSWHYTYIYVKAMCTCRVSHNVPYVHGRR